MTRALYPVGFFGFLFLNTLFNQWVVFAHASAGPLLLAGYAAQGALAPFWGHLSDLARARWGSRRLLTLCATPLLLLAFAGAMDAEAPAAAVLLYCLCFSVGLQPWLAMIPGLAHGDAARSRAMAVGMAFALGAAASALVAGPLLVARLGLSGLALAGAAVFALTSAVPALLVREGAAPASGARPAKLWAALREALQSPRARRFVLGATLLTATQMALVVSAPFVAGTLLGRGHGATAALNAVLVVGLLAALAAMARFGKRAHPLSLLRAGALVGAGALAALGAVTALPPGLAKDALCGAAFLALGALALCVVALPPLVAARLAEDHGGGQDGVFMGLSGAANGLGNALGALAAASLVQGGTLVGLRATLAFTFTAAVLAALALPQRSAR